MYRGEFPILYKENVFQGRVTLRYPAIIFSAKDMIGERIFWRTPV
jgi:hypothetical protein